MICIRIFMLQTHNIFQSFTEETGRDQWTGAANGILTLVIDSSNSGKTIFSFSFKIETYRGST